MGAVKCRGRVVSSSEVRQAIDEGNVSLAWRFLKRPYALSGEVVRGHGVGAKTDRSDAELADLARGVSARTAFISRGRATRIGRAWNSITNIGHRPTFGGDDLHSSKLSCWNRWKAQPPAHIRLEFLHRVREERKFENPEELKAQILRDVARVPIRLLLPLGCGVRADAD